MRLRREMVLVANYQITRAISIKRGFLVAQVNISERINGDVSASQLSVGFDPFSQNQISRL